MTDVNRCAWPKGELYIHYHDAEWGVPVHDDRKLFEMLILEGAQAGLSWETILKKRDHYREAFDNFDAERIVLYDDAKIATRLAVVRDDGVVLDRQAAAHQLRGVLIRENLAQLPYPQHGARNRHARQPIADAQADGGEREGAARVFFLG